MLAVDWEDESSYAFVNPHLKKEERDKVYARLPKHIFLTTSGSRKLKVVALSKEAFLISAQAVNDHIDATHKDIWINPLPHFHVGGLSIYARAFLSKSYLFRYDRKWSAERWIQFVMEKKGTLTSITPTQLWDLVENDIMPPKSLRGMFVGGGPLSDTLYLRGKERGWPLLPTFGMTEMCSQIATATPDSSRLKLLPHVQAKVSDTGKLLVKSEALLTGYYAPDFLDPKVEGWFETEDLVSLEGDYLIPQGRGTDVLKIKGELINLFELEEKLDRLKERLNYRSETALIPQKDERAGYKIYLYHTLSEIEPLIDAFNQEVIPEARIARGVFVKALPKNALGKIVKQL